MATPWVFFFATSTLLVLTVAPRVRRFMKSQRTEPVGLDALKGQRALVVVLRQAHAPAR